GYFLDGGMLIDRFFNAARIDVVARADDQVLDAVDDREEAAFIHDRDIAGAQEVANELLLGLCRFFPIALHDLRTFGAKFAALAPRNFPRRIVDIAKRNDRAR